MTFSGDHTPRAKQTVDNSADSDRAGSHVTVSSPITQPLKPWQVGQVVGPATAVDGMQENLFGSPRA